jgi:hypothetical protein
LAIGVGDKEKQTKIRSSAELAGNLGLVIRFAFCKTFDGAPLDKFTKRLARYLEVWLWHPDWSYLVIRDQVAGQLELCYTDVNEV